MKALFSIVSAMFVLSSFAQEEAPRFARGARIVCDGYVATVAARLVNNNVNVLWSNGDETRNYDPTRCTDISPLHENESVGNYRKGSLVACSGYFGTVQAVTMNGNIDIRWENGDEDVNQALASCENVSPVSNPSGGLKSGSDVICDGYIGTVQDVLMNGKANVHWRVGDKSRNYDTKNCTNISVDDVQSREGYSLNADLSCDGNFGKLIQFRVNESVDVLWDTGSITENIALKSCTNVSIIPEDLEISDVSRSIQKDFFIFPGSDSQSASAFSN
jgi:hypothetical protein